MGATHHPLLFECAVLWLQGKHREPTGKSQTSRVDFPFFSAIVLFNKQIHFSRVFGGFLERRIPGKNGEVTPIDILLV